MKHKEKLVIANFKMNLSAKIDLDHWLASFVKAQKDLKLDKTGIVLCPSDLYLDKFTSMITASSVEFGLQNCFWAENGAYTGETSPLAAHAMGAKYVILGHSERRKYLGETDEMVAHKVKMALKARLRPVICIGETAEQKEQDAMLDVVMSQLQSCLSGVSRGLIEEVILCYEPVWAISANKPTHPPSSNEIMGAKLLIRKFLVEQYGRNTADRVTVIYGGSVDSANVQEVVVSPDMDGALVGSASLRPYELVKIANTLEQVPELVQFSKRVRY